MAICEATLCHFLLMWLINMASNSFSPSEYHFTLLFWSAMDDTLHQHLSSLHHLLGNNVMDPATAAEDFSHLLSELLLELGMIESAPNSRPQRSHRPHPIKATLRNLSRMKNAARKSANTNCDKFVQLVRAHHVVKKCYNMCIQ